MAEETPTTAAQAAAEATDGKEVQELLERSARRQEERSGRVAREVAECLAIGDAPSHQVREDRRAATEAAFTDVEPGDEIASLLVAQLMTVHGMAMDCVRSARDPAREERLRLAYLSHSGRLLSLFSRHVGRLDRHNDWLRARVQEIMSQVRRIEAQHGQNVELKMYNDFIMGLVNKDRANTSTGEPPRSDCAPANDSDADEFAA
jgi:hypothetical protein